MSYILILDKNHANHSECMWSHHVIKLEAVGTSRSYETGEAKWRVETAAVLGDIPVVSQVVRDAPASFRWV